MFVDHSRQSLCGREVELVMQNKEGLSHYVLHTHRARCHAMVVLDNAYEILQTGEIWRKTVKNKGKAPMLVF